VSGMEEFAAPLAIARLMDGFERRWAVAGGWTIDLFLGRVTRPHQDVEVAIFRDDQRALYDYLAGWEMRKSIQPGWAPWHGERLELPIHEMVARRDGDPGHVEILLNERDGELWRFRRNLAIALPVERAIVGTTLGIPILAPEVALLYKAKGSRPKDQADFAGAIGALGVEQRRWLMEALSACYPGHAWMASLDEIGGNGATTSARRHEDTK